MHAFFLLLPKKGIHLVRLPPEKSIRLIQKIPKKLQKILRKKANEALNAGARPGFLRKRRGFQIFYF